MCLLDISLAALVRAGVVTRDEALLHADDAEAPAARRRRPRFGRLRSGAGSRRSGLSGEPWDTFTICCAPPGRAAAPTSTWSRDSRRASVCTARWCRSPAACELTPEALAALLSEGVSARQWQEFLATGDLDFALAVPGVARFRGNYLRQERGPSAVFRTIPEKIASLEELGLPAVLGRLAELRSGLVLVTGPTGSGKSTTLAAIVDRINRSSARHIVTIEEPVEFVHQNQRSVFSQREVGTDTVSFAAALRSAIRQDADVVLVGEMRDLETISLALKAAEMGVLVFGTLHTNSASKTIDRLIDVFPADEQPQARMSLADSLAAIVAQLLLPRAGGAAASPCTRSCSRPRRCPT